MSLKFLKRLIQALDDERNDIYIHFDRKLNHYPDCRTSYAKLTFLEERMDVRWGDISVVDAEFALFDEAYRRGNIVIIICYRVLICLLKHRTIFIVFLKKMREKSLLATIREIYPKKLTVKFVDGICSPKVLRKLKAAWL